ncbi:MAG: DUF1836 domain-containing protein [Clostridiales bacterium]
MDNFLNSSIAQNMVNFKLPRYNELPNIGLYMDQVILIIENSLKPLFSPQQGSIITSTMVSNYVKQKLVSPPLKKKYSQNHIAYLIVVCLLKQVYSISEICELIEIQINSYSIEVAYNYFCEEQENALQAAFSTRQFSAESFAQEVTSESELVRSGVLCFANKVYIQKYLQYKKMEIMDIAEDLQPRLTGKKHRLS